MKRAQANGLLISAAFLWGTGNVMQQNVLANMGPFSALGLRCLLALLIIVPFSRINKVPQCRVDKKGKIIGFLTVVFFFCAMLSQQIGFGYTSVTNAGFIVNLTTVLTPIFAWVCLSQKPQLIIWPAASASLIGAAFMSAGTLQGFNIGDFLCFVSAIFYSLWMVFLGLFVCQYKNVAVLTLIQFLVSGVICSALALTYETLTFSGLITALPSLVFLGLMSTGLAYLLQSIAQQYTTSSEAAVIASGESIFGAIGAIILLHEIPTVMAIIGAMLMCSGILMVQRPTHTWSKIKKP